MRACSKEGGLEPGDRLSFIAADLEKQRGCRLVGSWLPACEYPCCVASPSPPDDPQARRRADCARRRRRHAPRAACRARRRRRRSCLVLTSSFAAIGYGQKPQTTPFNETNWTEPNGDDMLPYVKSKTLAERAAWDFIANEQAAISNFPSSIRWACSAPVPGSRLFDVDPSECTLHGQRTRRGPDLSRALFRLPSMCVTSPICIFTAMTHPAAKGERSFLAVAGDFMSVRDIAKVLKSHLGRGRPRECRPCNCRTGWCAWRDLR